MYGTIVFCLIGYIWGLLMLLRVQLHILCSSLDGFHVCFKAVR